ncbi:MAG TPA: PhoU domain-containing protein [Acidimicrobiia bacterium]|nr:PhoU domain-containing protein [Acidimicrobiia bacterium]
MVFELFKGQSESPLEAIEGGVRTMLATSGRVLELAVSAFEAGTSAREIGHEVRKTDREVNKAERSIRRELVVHVSVQAGANLPLVLVYMSIIKDIERIGDYAKNIWDVAVAVEGRSEGPDLTALRPLFDRTIALVSEIGELYAARDVERATATLNKCDDWLDEYDATVDALMLSTKPSTIGVPEALLNRHLKRITAHLMNVLTAVVMPIDRLDYWDEDKIDRQ